MTITIADLDTPLGVARLAERDGALCALTFDGGWERVAPALDARFDEPFVHGTARAAAHLAAYFDGDVGAPSRIEVAAGGTEFQRAVWARLREIPHGEVRTYAELAATIGAPRAARAVGSAVGANPVAIVVPCHRVVRADGGLGGYAYGTDRKRRLLALERAPLAAGRLG